MKTANTTTKWILAPAFAIVALLLLAPERAHAANDRVDPRGFIYGTVHTSNGNEYTGILRWGTEEAFWGDLFNGTKDELPYLDRSRREKRRSRIKVFGVTVGYRWEDDYNSSRAFVARFGDIQEIRPQGGDRAQLIMKSGSKIELDGGSNDIGAKIAVLDGSVGELDVAWNRIKWIRFAAAPAGTEAPARRLRGRVITTDGTFEGFVQWDSQECLASDKLDGDTEDGDVSIPMGRIRSIEKNNRRGSWVELNDGRRLRVEGSNDVDHSLRGIFVEDERYGRVKITWDAFERAEFVETSATGPGYADFAPGGQLRGKVLRADGSEFRGDLVYDLDEQESWEVLHGDRNDVEFLIPFGMIRTIRPKNYDSSVIVLKNGLELTLEDSQDVSERNDGILILRAEREREVHVPWQEVDRIEFD